MTRMAEQEATIRDQAETIGQLRAELAAHAPTATVEAPTSTEGPDLTNRVIHTVVATVACGGLRMVIDVELLILLGGVLTATTLILMAIMARHG